MALASSMSLSMASASRLALSSSSSHSSTLRQLLTPSAGSLAVFRSTPVPGIRSQFKDSDTDKVKQQAQDLGNSLQKTFEGQQKEGILQESPISNSGNLGFTKKNELFVGRMAMLGFASSLIGEAITGRGIVGQLNIETGIPVEQAPPLLLAWVAFNLIGAFTAGFGSSGYKEGDPAAAQKTRSIRGFLGLPDKGPLFGFTRPNEFLNGRLAQLGFAISIVNEILTGRGAFGQISQSTGLPVETLQGLFLFIGPIMLIASVNLGEGRLVNDKDIP